MKLYRALGIFLIFALLCSLLFVTASAANYQFVDHEVIKGKCIGTYNPPAGPQVKIDAGDMIYVLKVTEKQFSKINPGEYYSFEENHRIDGEKTYTITKCELKN